MYSISITYPDFENDEIYFCVPAGDAYPVEIEVVDAPPNQLACNDD